MDEFNQSGQEDRQQDSQPNGSQNNGNYNNMNNNQPNFNNYQNYHNTNPNNSPDGKPPKKNWKKFVAGMAAVLSFALVGTGGFYLADQLALQMKQNLSMVKKDVKENTETTQETTLPQTEGAEATTDSVSDVVTNVMPAIVSITTNATRDVQGFFGNQYQEPVQGSGSGIIIGQNSKEVLIATNNHVISGKNAQVAVTFCDDESVQATVKGADASADLAVVSVRFADIKDSTKKKILVASLGDSDKTKVGETAIAIGNALGYGISVTVGHISALDREIAVEDSSMVLMQTDAAINPGNSGGALLNAKGEVIGINSAKTATTEVEGMGYAIPISDALPIINDLMSREQLSDDEQAYLGAIGESIDQATAKRLGFPVGVYVMEVTEGSPAEQAGIVPGMIIVGMSGKEVKNNADLKSILSYSKAGETAKINVKVNIRGEYVDKEITVKLGSKAESKSTPDESQDNNTDQYGDNGDDDYGYSSPFDFFR